jgi:hypothetical protein
MATFKKQSRKNQVTPITRHAFQTAIADITENLSHPIPLKLKKAYVIEIASGRQVSIGSFAQEDSICYE